MSNSPVPVPCPDFHATARLYRAHLEQSLEGMLGYYVTDSDRTVPAIQVVEGRELQVYQRASGGIEVVLRFPDLLPEALLGGYTLEYRWTLYLKQWDPDRGTREAVRRILACPVWQVGGTPRFVPASERDGIPETATLFLRDFGEIQTA